MSWTNDQTLEFLLLYQAEGIIWDPTHSQHKNRNSVTEAWQRIQSSFSLECSLTDLKKKKESLMSTYRTHIAKRRQLQHSGSGGEVYHTSWYAFELMDSFLAPVYDRASESTNVETTNPEVDTASGDDELIQAKEETMSEPGSSQNPSPKLQVYDRQSITREVWYRKRPELIIWRKEMDLAIATIKSLQERGKEMDEVELYCQLLAKRIKKFDEPIRDSIMWDIDQILHEHKEKKISHLKF